MEKNVAHPSELHRYIGLAKVAEKLDERVQPALSGMYKLGAVSLLMWRSLSRRVLAVKVRSTAVEYHGIVTISVDKSREGRTHTATV